MVLDVTRCVSIAGEIVRAKGDEHWAADSVDQQICRQATGKLIEKADHLLHRLWAPETFLSFVRKHARAMYGDYLSYCRLAGHPFPLRSKPPTRSPIEGRDRLTMLVDLLLGYVETISLGTTPQ
jgi:hypothetical protein